MRSRRSVAGEDSLVRDGAFVAPTWIQSACVQWCSELAANLCRGPLFFFFRKKKQGAVCMPSGVARQGIQVQCAGGESDCEGEIGEPRRPEKRYV